MCSGSLLHGRADFMILETLRLFLCLFFYSDKIVLPVLLHSPYLVNLLTK